MEELYEMLEDNKDRLDEVQKMIKERQDGMLIAPRPADDDKIMPVDQSTLAPDALKRDTMKGEAAPNVLQSDTNADALTTENVDSAVEIAAEKMIYTFLGVLVGAILVGVLIGCICIFTVLKCHKRNQ